MRVERSLAVDESEDVANERRMRAVPDLFNVELVGDPIGLRVYLAATLQLEGLFRKRLKPPAVDTGGVAECSEVERHCFDARFDHEIARHARIILEVPVKEPRIVSNGRLAAHEAAPPRPTG